MRFVKVGYERVIVPMAVAPLITITLNQTLVTTTFGMAEGLITTDEGVGIPDGEGSGALSGYHLDRKLVSWYPK